MMQNGVGASFGGWVGAGYHAVTLPYRGVTSMVLIVPDAGTFDAFEAGTNAADLEAILSPTPSSSYVLSMPRFKIATALALKSTLSKMGMTDAFTEGAADLSGIDGARDISLTAVVHKAMISVDENGTEAAEHCCSSPCRLRELRIEHPPPEG
jgi:serpin B